MSMYFVVALALCVCAQAQQVWKVDCNGSQGTHFVDLPQAVAAAAPNDEILVYNTAGCGSVYAAPIIDKPLRIIGFRPSVQPGSSVPSGVNVFGVMLVIGIMAGEQVVVSNVDVGGPGGTGPMAIVGLDCQGQILLEDVAFASLGFPNAYLHFERCQNVVMRGCEVRLGGQPMRFIDSTALMSWCSVYHILPGLGIWPGYTHTSEGLLLASSDVTVVGTTIWGNDQYSFSPPSSWIARPAVRLESGTLRMGASSNLVGGMKASGQREISYRVYQPTTGSVEMDSRAFVDRYPSTASLCCPPVPRERSSVHSRYFVAGESYEVWAFGPAGGFAALMLGDWHPYATPTPWGALALDPLNAQIVDIVALPGPDGFYQWNGAIPAAMQVAHAFAFQAVTLDANGVIQLSIPSPFAVGWPHGVIP